MLEFPAYLNVEFPKVQVLWVMPTYPTQYDYVIDLDNDLPF